MKKSVDHSSPIRKISKQDLHLETTTRLAELIASSEPGSRLPTERELSERLGVGRSTVREAVRSLSFIGAVQARQGAGTYVTTGINGAVERLIGLGLMVHRSKVNEVIEVRRFLEIQSVRLAAERHLGEDIEQMSGIIENMRASSQDLKKATLLDLEFHVKMAEASHNSVLVFLINGMRTLLEIWMDKAVNRVEVLEAIIDEHERILEAVAQRKADEAAAHMSRHQAYAAERLLATIGQDKTMADYASLIMAPRSS